MQTWMTIAAALLVTCFGMTPVNAGSWVAQIQGPQYFAVSVEDVDRSVDWYVKVFALEQLDDTSDPEGAWRIVNVAGDDLFVEIIRDNRDESVARARGFAKVGFGVADLEAVADRVERATGSRPRVISFAEHEVKILQLRDPDGNVVQLSSPLSVDQDAPAGESAEIATDSGLVYKVLEQGTGPIAAAGDSVLIHERTTLPDGTLVTDTWALNSPIRFEVGAQQVIDGVDEAVRGMRVGERRRLVVPPGLSKRTQYPENGLFGPQDTLHYDLLLLKVDPGNKP
jgi:predicted enzyme related to lactoylglutathione lyase